MRSMMVLPLAAACALAGCGSDGGADADGDGEITAAEAAREMASMDAPRPGQYRTTIEIEEFNIPGMPQSMMNQMSGNFTGNFSSTYCQAEADSERAVKDMTDAIGRGDCTYNSFDVSGNSFSVDMTCNNPEGGGQGRYKLNGTMHSTGSDLQMEMEQQVPDMAGGPMTMKAHMTSERIGDCET